VFFSFRSSSGGILYLGIYTCFRCVLDPLAHKYLVFQRIEVAALALLNNSKYYSHVIDPVPLEMVSTSFCEDSIATAFPHGPHTLIHIAVGIDHTALSMRLVVKP
jgi:hypothetical protein